MGVESQVKSSQFLFKLTQKNYKKENIRFYVGLERASFDV